VRGVGRWGKGGRGREGARRKLGARRRLGAAPPSPSLPRMLRPAREHVRGMDLSPVPRTGRGSAASADLCWTPWPIGNKREGSARRGRGETGHGAALCLGRREEGALCARRVCGGAPGGAGKKEEGRVRGEKNRRRQHTPRSHIPPQRARAHTHTHAHARTHAFLSPWSRPPPPPLPPPWTRTRSCATACCRTRARRAGSRR